MPPGKHSRHSRHDKHSKGSKPTVEVASGIGEDVARPGIGDLREVQDLRERRREAAQCSRSRHGGNVGELADTPRRRHQKLLLHSAGQVQS